MKFCPRCRKLKSSSEFYRSPNTKSGLSSWCMVCYSEVGKERYIKNRNKIRQRTKEYAASEKGAEVQRKSKRKYRDTIKGHLALIFNAICRRCTNSSCENFKYYGGRGIENKFASLNDFRYYVTEILGADPRGLQIDRIDNNGHYEKGNIRFVTAKENSNNRGR